MTSLADPDAYPAGVVSLQTIVLPLGSRFWQRTLNDASSSAVSLAVSCDKANGPCAGDCMGAQCCIWRPVEFTRTQITLTSRRVLLSS